jgi:phage protein D/phage baseplate assembly protein gpV
LPETTLLLSQFYVKIEGTEAPDDMMLNLVEATVENSLHLPDVATLILHDPNGKWVDHANLAPGKPLTIEAKAGQEKHSLFDGEIVELESDFLPGDRRVVVRAFDRLHRLARGRHVRSFVNVTDADIVQKIASECGLTPECGPASTVHPYVMQDNTTNLEFLRHRAALLGYLLFVQGKELHCEEHGTQTGNFTLTFGEDLREFHPRLTTVDQVSDASASGWDPTKRETVIGKAANANGAPQVASGTQGGAMAHQAFGVEASILVADRPVRTQSVAEKLAQASLDRREGRFIEAEGTTRGTPSLVAGVSVQLQQLGNRFSGKYFVTNTTHSYTADGGYVTRFVVSGFKTSSLLSLLEPERDGLPAPRIGLVVGLVTDNNDPDGMGRVKVKYPWLSQDHASDWARVVIVGGGPQRGFEYLPEVNDEVLVGFEQGDINYPYVLGGLWNGKDAPPSKNADVIASGKVNKRIIRSRTGHLVTLNDSEDEPSITIVDNTGKNTIKFDSKSNKLTVHFEGDMLLDAPNGDIAIKGKTITAEATEGVTVKGKSLDASADTTVNIKATSDLKLKGANAEMQADANVDVKGAQANVQANAKLSLSGGAMTEVKGAMINIG